MEFRDALQTYTRHRFLGVAIVAVTVGAAFLWSAIQPVRYSTSMSLGVNRANKDATADYQYDGYYALQAADLFSQTLVSWMQTPSILLEIYRQAELSTDEDAIRGVTGRFKTKKVAAQNVVVTYASPTKDEAERLAAAITKVTSELTKDVNRDASNQSLFELRAATPVIVRAKTDPLLLGLGAGVIGIVLAMFAVPFITYLAGAQRPN